MPDANGERLRHECPCGSGEHKEAQYDAQNIFLCYTCDQCHHQKMSQYRPCILSGYTQADVDEPIDAED